MVKEVKSPPLKRIYIAALIVVFLVGVSGLGGSARESSQKQTEAELITVRSRGFDPSEINRPQGPFVLALDNHSGSEELSLQLSRQDGGGMKQVHFFKRQSKHRESIDLPPGRYVLTESNHCST